MSTASRNVSDGVRRSQRENASLTRAGNGIDSFPFHKLSVDGAELAKSIISPLADPTFAMMRARDPLDLDSTSSTYDSSDRDASPPRSTEKNLRIREEDIVDKSKGSKNSSPPSSTSRDSTDQKDAFRKAMNSLPSVTENEPSTASISAPSASDRYYDSGQQLTPDKLNQTSRTDVTASSSSTSPSASSPPSTSKRSVDKAMEPEANHISPTKSRDSQTDHSRNSDPDTYYEVYDSPRAGEIYDGPLNDADLSVRSEDFSSLQLPLSPSNNFSRKPGVAASMSTVSYQTSSPSGRSSRIDVDGSVHLSRNYQYDRKLFPTEGIAEYSETPVDPDGDIDIEETHSTHGESIQPTMDDNNNLSFVSEGAPSSSDYPTSGRTASSADYDSSDGDSGDYEEQSESDTENNIDVAGMATPRTSSAASTDKSPEERTSLFPSYRLLVCIAVMIVLVVAGLVAGLTYYLWEKKSLDPIRPPDGLGPNDPSSMVPGLVDPSDGDVSGLSPLIPTDQELYDIFESVVGEGAKLNFTMAGKAADWMIKEDPGKALKIRSDDAWIQRYLLVYTYFVTTLNRSTSWLSCNPLIEEEGNPMFSDKDACKFTYPTELPGGKVIYDLVPSSRWLSAADECQWGGVSCSVTVTDEITALKAEVPGLDRVGVSNLPVQTNMTRSAVTSIVLADQYLKGAIVTELTALPMLEHLDLSHNGLKGTLSEKFRSLKTLRLQYNVIEDKIPSNFFDDQSAMKELNIGSNKMTGTIPSKVGLASRMNSLYLFENNFNGRIPVLGNMPLINFQAQENEFTGMLPFDYSFGGTWADTLREWWVFDNQLTGSLSDNLGFLTSLEDLRINNNKITGSIPESILDLQRLFRLDVHTNALTGTVPEGIGDLPVLRDVRLQFNNLDGIVPTSLCFLESMEVLEADCLVPELLGSKPQTDCYCCTTCCNPAIGLCQYY